MKTTVQLEWTDYLAASRLGSPYNTANLVILAALAALGLMSDRGWLTLRLLVPLILLNLYFLFVYSVLLPYTVKKIFRQTRAAALSFELEVLPAGLRKVDAYSSFFYPWNAFASLRENPHHVMLMAADGYSVILPKRQLPASLLDQLRANYMASPHPPRPRQRGRRSLPGLVSGFITLATIVVVLGQSGLLAP